MGENRIKEAVVKSLEKDWNCYKEFIESHIKKNPENVPLREVIELHRLSLRPKEMGSMVTIGHDVIPHFLDAIRNLLRGSKLDESNTIPEILAEAKREQAETLAAIKNK